MHVSETLSEQGRVHKMILLWQPTRLISHTTLEGGLGLLAALLPRLLPQGCTPQSND